MPDGDHGQRGHGADDLDRPGRVRPRGASASTGSKPVAELVPGLGHLQQAAHRGQDRQDAPTGPLMASPLACGACA